MSSHTNIRLAAIAAIVSAAGFTLMATPSQASLSNKIGKCDGASRHEVVKCCDTVLRNNPPSFMFEGRADCNRMTVCVRLKSANYCHIVLLPPPKDTDKPDKKADNNPDRPTTDKPSYNS